MKKASQPTTAGERRFGASVREFREAKGLSQTQLAMKMIDAGWSNFHQGTISRTESNERPIRLGEAISLSEILGVSLDVLTGSSSAEGLHQSAGMHALQREAEESRHALEALHAELSMIASRVHAVSTRHAAVSEALAHVTGSDLLGAMSAMQPADPTYAERAE